MQQLLTVPRNLNLELIEALRVLLMDIDGVAVKPKYDTTGMIQAGPDWDSEKHFAFQKRYNKNEDNVPQILTSGRSLSQIKGIAKRSENKNLIIHEHGMGVYNPVKDADISIFDEVKELERYKGTVAAITELRLYLQDRFKEILKELQEIGYKNVEKVVMAPGKKYTIAIDIPYVGVYGKSNRVDRIEFFKSVWKFIPEEYKKEMSTPQEEFYNLVGKRDGSDILVYVDASAVNIKPPISKPTALKYLLKPDGQFVKAYGIEKETEIGLVDDRDIDSMRAMPGPIFAPGDASDEVKQEVFRRYALNGSGYASVYENIWGQRDILARINAISRN